MNKKLFIFNFLVICLFSMTCALAGPTGTAKITLGLSADYPPFAFQQNGKIVGLEVDLAKAIAEKAEFDLTIQDMDFSGIIPSLKSGRIQIGMSAISVTPERQKNVDFSDEYYRVTPALLVMANSGIESKYDLINKSITAQLGTTLEDLAIQFSKDLEGVQATSAARTIQLVEELKIGRVQAVVIDEDQAKAFAKVNNKLKVIPLPEEALSWAAAFPKGSPYVASFNKALLELKTTGELNEIIEKWTDLEEDSLFDSIQEDMPSIIYIIKGSLITLKYTLISVFFGLILGTIIALSKVSHKKLIKLIANTYTSVFRGTPVLVQLSLVYFALPAITGYQISAFAAGIIAFSLNSAAYVSESIRGGIQSVDKGQIEAAQALGVPYRLMMKDIILPQAIRNILPALANEIVNLLKETAIISMIGVSDLMRRAQVVAAEKYSFLMPLLVAAGCYYLLVMIFSTFARYLELKLKQS